MRQPAVEAASAIIQVMSKGSAKDGKDESWRDKPITYHLGKGAKHAVHALMMYTGIIPEDEEGWKQHLKNAITRLAFVLTYD